MVNAASPRLWVPRSVELKRNRPGAVRLPTNADRSAVNIDRTGNGCVWGYGHRANGCVWGYRHRAMLQRPGQTILSQRAVRMVTPGFCEAAGRRNSAHGADRTLFCPVGDEDSVSALCLDTDYAGEAVRPHREGR